MYKNLEESRTYHQQSVEFVFKESLDLLSVIMPNKVFAQLLVKNLKHVIKFVLIKFKIVNLRKIVVGY